MPSDFMCTKLPVFNATNYRISTITVTGGINSEVNLNLLYEQMLAYPFDEVHYIEHGESKHDLKSYGTMRKKPRKKNSVQKKRFDNQLTIVFQFNENMYNAKLFKNGNIQITGVKNIENGHKAIDKLIDMLKTLYLHDERIITDIDAVENVNYRVRLINSDFKVNFEIRLDYLYRLMTEAYNIVCSYEPCIYPGAKIEYYYNKDGGDGTCKCEGTCNGKADHCKKITIAIFQSGCVIITGANCVDHINVAYRFICDALSKNIDAIYRRRLLPPPPL